MILTFYGVRGSYPIARQDQIRYGGNTTCIHLKTNAGQELIVDGGSGIRVLGQEMMQRQFGKGEGKAIILIGHTHWDHVMGYPFFRPYYVAGNQFIIASAGQPGIHIQDILSGQQSDLNFPVSLEYFESDIEFYPFTPSDSFKLGEFYIETVQLNHPGITVGYRIEADGGAITVYTDTARVREIRLGEGLEKQRITEKSSELLLNQLAYCARESDVLIYDTHFLEYEMYGRYGWGHSTVEDALELARLANVKKLSLFHYAPEHSDSVVDQQLAMAKDLSRYDTFEVIAAAEGLKVEINHTHKIQQQEG